MNRTGKGGFREHPQNAIHNGKKNSVSFTSALKSKLETIPKGEKKTYLKLITEKILNMALAGNEQMLKLVANYTDGMPKQSMELGSNEDIQIIVHADLSKFPLPILNKNGNNTVNTRTTTST